MAKVQLPEGTKMPKFTGNRKEHRRQEREWLKSNGLLPVSHETPLTAAPVSPMPSSPIAPAQSPPPSPPDPPAESAVAPDDPRGRKPDIPVFVGILFGTGAFVLFLLQANGVDVNWLVSAGGYLICALVCAWTVLRHGVPEPSNKSRYAWAAFVFLFITGLGGYGATKQYKRDHTRLALSTTSEMVAVVHNRAMWRSDGSGNTDVYKAIFQDIFHDWKITLVPQGTPANVVITIQDARNPTDQIQVVPNDHAEILPVAKKWASGFEEPNQTPDFFIRKVRFDTLTSPTTITLRKPIKSKQDGENQVTTLDLDLDRTVQVSCEGCEIKEVPLAGIKTRFASLVAQLRTLAAKNWAQPGDTPMTTRLDPDTPYPPLKVNESEMLMEVKCQNAVCDHFTVNMEQNPKRIVAQPSGPYGDPGTGTAKRGGS